MAMHGNKIAPWFADWYPARTGYDSQQTNEPVGTNLPNALSPMGYYALIADGNEAALVTQRTHEPVPNPARAATRCIHANARQRSLGIWPRDNKPVRNRREE
jgi:hypothetical protein